MRPTWLTSTAARVAGTLRLNDCYGGTETFRSTLALGRMRPLGEVHHREGPMQTRRTFQSASKASRPGYRSTLESLSASRSPESASGQTSILDGQHANPGRTTRHSKVAAMQTRVTSGQAPRHRRKHAPAKGQVHLLDTQKPEAYCFPYRRLCGSLWTRSST